MLGVNVHAVELLQVQKRSCLRAASGRSRPAARCGRVGAGVLLALRGKEVRRKRLLPAAVGSRPIATRQARRTNLPVLIHRFQPAVAWRRLRSTRLQNPNSAVPATAAARSTMDAWCRPWPPPVRRTPSACSASASDAAAGRPSAAEHRRPCRRRPLRPPVSVSSEHRGRTGSGRAVPRRPAFRRGSLPLPGVAWANATDSDCRDRRRAPLVAAPTIAGRPSTSPSAGAAPSGSSRSRPSWRPGFRASSGCDGGAPLSPKIVGRGHDPSAKILSPNSIHMDAGHERRGTAIGARQPLGQAQSPTGGGERRGQAVAAGTHGPGRSASAERPVPHSVHAGGRVHASAAALPEAWPICP